MENNQTQTTMAPETGEETRSGKYLSFALGEEEYGVPVLAVQEIIGMMPITKVPQTQSYIRGVINLRGKVIPVIDLRLKFDMEEREADNMTCIIVVEVAGMLMGIVIDTVHEVFDIEGGQIEDAPAFGSSVNTDFILGMGKVGDRVIILLDIEKVLTDEEHVIVAGMANTNIEEGE